MKLGGAGGRGRTDTPFGNTILSRARLPIPPHRLGGLAIAATPYTAKQKGGSVTAEKPGFVQAWAAP